MSKRTDILFDTRGAIVKKHAGGRPRSQIEPRVKVSLQIKRSALRELESIKQDERRRLEKAGNAAWRAVSVTSLIGDAIDAYIAKHKVK
jgi:hypothetical protein